MRTEPSFSEESENALEGVDQSASALSSRFDADSSLLADYRQRYGLSTDPFADDPHFPFYQGAQRRQILEQLLHLCQFSHNLLVVSGDYGVGKTRMAQALIDALNDIDDICFVEGQVTSDINSVLTDVYDQFELTSHEDFVDLCTKKSEQDGLVVLIVDNAHHLSDKVILDLIGLLQESPESRLHLVLFSEPYLLDRLESINAPDIILTDFFLQKLSLVEAVDYLNFRMEMADYLGPEIFVENKVEPWWRQSQGQLLQLHEYAHNKLLESVAKPQRPRGYLSEKRGLPIPHIIAASALVGGLFFWYLYQGRDSKSQVEPVTSSTTLSSQSFTESSSTVAQPSSLAANPVAAISPEATTSLASSSIAHRVDAETIQPAVKQSVVPLVQTNDLQNGTVKQGKSEVGTSVKAEKKLEVSSEPTKPVAKVKTEAPVVNEVKTTQGYSDQEKTILGWDASEYTLQLVGLSNEKAAREFIASQPNKKDLLLFRSKRAGKDWFVIVTGRYASSAKARQAIQNLADEQKRASPWPREIKVIQQEIKMY
jgi:DamX protein